MVQELAEVKNDRNVLIKNKEEALAQVEKFHEALQKALEKSNQGAQVATQKIQALESNIQKLKIYALKLQTEANKTTILKAEILKSRMEKEATQKEYTNLANRYKLQAEQMKVQETNLGALKTVNQEYEKQKNWYVASISVLKERLDADLSDVQNFKSDFLTSLESLVANFSQRKEKSDASNTVSAMQQNLKLNLSDVQNLKSNFEAYLESLVLKLKERH